MSVSQEVFDRRFYFGKIVMPCPICAREMYEVPHSKQNEETCKKYMEYRAHSGHLFHLLYELLGKEFSDDQLADALVEVLEKQAERDDKQTEKTLTKLRDFIQKNQCDGSCPFDSMNEGRCYDYESCDLCVYDHAAESLRGEREAVTRR